MYFHELSQNSERNPEAVRVAPAVGSAETNLRAACDFALNRPYADLPLSKRNGAEYARLRKQRRDDLEALLRRGIDDINRGKALDLVCALCEESAWSGNGAEQMDDMAHPGIDLFAAETACLLAWVRRELPGEVRVRSRVLYELRRRIFTPLIAHDDYSVFRPDTPLALAALSEIVVAALLAEDDFSRQHSLLKRLAKVLDALIEADPAASLAESLTNHVAAVSLWEIDCRMTGRPGSEAFPPYPWLDSLLLSHLTGDRFCDPVGEGVTETVNGADVFFLGRLSGDSAVEALGASLYRRRACAPSVLSARLLADFTQDMIMNDAPVPRLKHGSLPDHSVMLARGGDLLIQMHAGGKGNAGGLCVCRGAEAILLSQTEDAPVVNGCRQKSVRGAGDCEFDEDRADLTMDVTHCYSPEAGIRFAQRTAMLDRDSGTLRIIDMVECRTEGEIAYTFYTPCRPVPAEGGVTLGKTRMTWEGGVCRVTEGQLFRMEMTFRLRPGSNMIHFVLE